MVYSFVDHLDINRKRKNWSAENSNKYGGSLSDRQSQLYAYKSGHYVLLSSLLLSGTFKASVGISRQMILKTSKKYNKDDNIWHQSNFILL